MWRMLDSFETWCLLSWMDISMLFVFWTFIHPGFVLYFIHHPTFFFFYKVSTGAYERLVFTVPGGNPLRDRKEINRITWASWTRYADHLGTLFIYLLLCNTGYLSCQTYRQRVLGINCVCDILVSSVMKFLVCGLETQKKLTSTAPIFRPAVSPSLLVTTLDLWNCSSSQSRRNS